MIRESFECSVMYSYTVAKNKWTDISLTLAVVEQEIRYIAVRLIPGQI